MLVYIVLRPQLATLLVDIWHIPASVLSEPEAGVFLAYMLLCGIALLRWRFYVRPQVFRMRIADDITDTELYEPAVDMLYETWRKHLIDAQSVAEYDIAARLHSTVFAITGHWRAGKTTAAGQFVQKLRHDDIELRGEYYHDSFNFGNVSDSITSFFAQLAEMTRIEEFETLGQVSTPRLDSSIEIGPITINNPFQDIFTRQSTNVLRQTVHAKLQASSGSYVVIIDDLDRLKVDEQLMWLRVIELLGRFSGKIILLVPVNMTILEKMVEDALVSRQYIDKILPMQLPVGVDLEYIRKRMLRNNLGFKRQELFAKYVMSLGLRIAASEHELHRETSESWRARLRAGEVSTVLRQLHRQLSFREGSNGFGSVQYYREFYFVKDDGASQKEAMVLDTEHDKRIIMSTGELYESFFGGELMKHDFGRRPFHQDQPNDFSADSARTIRSYGELQRLFGSVRYRYGKMTREASYSTLPDEVITREGSYWFDFVFPAIQQVESDSALSRYFSYRQIDREINMLVEKKDKDVATYLAQLVYDNKTAR